MASAQTHRAMGTQITLFHMGLEDEDVSDLCRGENKNIPEQKRMMRVREGR